jgi:hypothetical protein
MHRKQIEVIGKLRGITIDWSPLERVDESPTEFPVVVEDILLKRARSGIGYLEWELSITGELHNGRRLHHITSLSTAARHHLWVLFRAFGIDDVKMTLELEDEEVRWVVKGQTLTRIDRHVTSPDLVGAAAIAVVENDSYEDRPQVRVVKLLPQA